ncbi:MFS family permease [Neobacillus niacini]|uniref:MFS transporter n=1 Tax=Neobacillus niacini TaxID=86668 RepID=UPI002859084F|nr:MFS transporter [Neobacillus niacini]MDR7077332.1 MFS family permease [Neobacillus niacini]
MKAVQLNTVPESKGPWYKDINKQQWKALIGAFLGWALDAFDFLLYNFVIVTLIKEWGLTTASTGLVASVTVVASALGGMVFGRVADRYGRMKALTITVLIYSVATGLSGLSQNIWQLMLFRVFVGLGMGGEWSAGAALISETWPKEHRGKAMSIMQSGYAFGGLMAALVAGPMIQAFGWRSVFFIGILPALLVFWIRRHVKEPEIWTSNEAEKGSKAVAKTSWFDLFRGNLLKLTIVGTLFCIIGLGASYPISIWLPAYLGTPAAGGGAGLSVVNASLYMIPFYLGSIIGYIVFGFLSDKIGRKKSFALYFLGAAIAIPAFILIGADNLIVFFILMALVGVCAVGFYGGFGTVLAEMYPTSLRGSGQGFAYNFARGVSAFAITGAGAIAMTVGIGNALIYTSILFIIAIFATLLLPETKGKELE